MAEKDLLQYALHAFSGLEGTDFQASMPYWHAIEYKKGDYFNRHKNVCRHLGFIVKGVFRSFIVDGKTGEEKNVFLYSQNQFVVSFKSFIQQTPCDYHTQAMTDALVLGISLEDLSIGNCALCPL